MKVKAIGCTATGSLVTTVHTYNLKTVASETPRYLCTLYEGFGSLVEGSVWW